MAYEGMIAETISIAGDKNQPISAYVARPLGAGPFPGMVLAHPCSGVTEHTTVWGKLLASWGYVVVAPDSFGPRGEKSVCGRGNVVNGNMRVADARVTIRFFRKANGDSTYDIIDKRGSLRVVRQPSPWSLTAGLGERAADILSSVVH